MSLSRLLTGNKNLLEKENVTGSNNRQKVVTIYGRPFYLMISVFFFLLPIQEYSVNLWYASEIRAGYRLFQFILFDLVEALRSYELKSCSL